MSKVFVGLSGGVDSAVSAALLKEQGHDVTGAFIKIWQPEFLECTWREDRLDAMRVAAALGIPFKEIDLSEVYERDVIGSMLRTYEAGQTPNPDVLCNRAIKFGAFAHWAYSQGAELVATGHYAQARAGRLYRGADASKDQSYFLHRVDASDIRRAIFPVGEMEKTDVRAYAERHRLPVAGKPDSQGLCFVGDITMGEFLRRYIDVREGDVIDVSGTVIGRHEGAVLYTIGQRHGFMLSGASPAAMYVIALDVAKNTITVSPERADAAVQAVLVEDPHWIRKPDAGQRLTAQVRYREKTVAASIESADRGMRVMFDMPQIVAPGQSLVLYQGDECVGGGAMRVCE